MVRRMNPGLQEHLLKKRLKRRGIEPDLIDVHAHMDRTLSLPENITQFEEKFNIGSSEMGQEEVSSKQRKATIRQARKIHNQRPKFNRMIDESIRAERVFKNPTEKQFGMWRKNPDEYDIKGVDTKLPAGQRTEAKVPANRRKRVLFENGSDAPDGKDMGIPNPESIVPDSWEEIDKGLGKESMGEKKNVGGGMAAVRHEKLVEGGETL